MIHPSFHMIFSISLLLSACCSSQATYSGQDMQNSCMAQYDYSLATSDSTISIDMAVINQNQDEINSQFPSCTMPIFNGSESIGVKGDCRFNLDVCDADEIAYLSDFRCLAKGLGACCIPKDRLLNQSMSDSNNIAQVSDCVSLNGFCVPMQENPCQGAVDRYHRVDGLCIGNALMCCMPNE